MKRLITIDDLLKIRPLAKGISQSRIDPYIDEAQEIDLLNVLGEALYYDFMTRYDQVGDGMYQKYQDLLNGKVYTPPGATYSFEYTGIRTMLSYFMLARLVSDQAINVTRYGLVTKEVDESTQVDVKALDRYVQTIRSVGINYQTRVIKFLRDNPGDYPLYNIVYKETLNNNGVKFFEV